MIGKNELKAKLDDFLLVIKSGSSAAMDLKTSSAEMDLETSSAKKIYLSACFGSLASLASSLYW